MKQKQRRKKRKERKTRNKKEAKIKDKKEERKKRTREIERERERNWKKGRPKKAKGKQTETLKNKQKCPFLGGKQGFCLLETKERIKNKGKTKPKKQIRRVRAKWGGPSGHLTWPLNPPQKTNKKTKLKKNKHKKKNRESLGPGGPSGHLTWPLNPPKKKTKTKNPPPPKKKEKNTKIPKKRAFQLSVKLVFFGGCVQKVPFWQLCPESAHPKEPYKYRGFSKALLEKTVMRHETAIFGQKNPNPEIPVIIFCLFSLSTKNTKISWTPPPFL